MGSLGPIANSTTITMMKLLVFVLVFGAVVALADSLPYYSPGYGYSGYGRGYYGYRGGYGGYPRPFPSYGKRSADAEADAVAEALDYMSHRDKRSADAEADAVVEANPDPDPLFWSYGWGYRPIPRPY